MIKKRNFIISMLLGMLLGMLLLSSLILGCPTGTDDMNGTDSTNDPNGTNGAAEDKKEIKGCSDKTTLQAAIATETDNQGNEANLNCIDTSTITDMSGLFDEKTQFNGDISKWDVSKVTNMNNMFNEAKAFNKDISGWDVKNVTVINFMFNHASAFNQDLSAWADKVGKVEYWSEVFDGSGISGNEPTWYRELLAQR